MKERTDRVEKETLPLNTIIHGDALDVLLTFPNESVNCIVTSPPYWGLRNYGTEPLIWGGDVECEHEFGNTIIKPSLTGGVDKALGYTINQFVPSSSSSSCLKCGAWLGSYGLEPTPELYVQHTVEVFREVKRVLRKDGTCWINLGSSYCSRVIESQEMVLRDDLTLEERRYVLEELAKHAR